MAIGKVNAYATVEAPKADFGAVAQLNIDNLVKSAKEDEQLKAAKAAAADKAKQEREKDLKLFPNVTATGATAVDTFYLQQSKKDFDLSNQYKRDWIDNSNYESKAKYESLIHHYGDMNNNLANFGAQVTKFSEKAGDGKSLYKKNAEYGMNIVKSMDENRLRISRDDDGNVKFGIYKEEDGKMVLDKVVDQATYYKDINNPVPNIDIDADAKATKGVYEKSLTETYSGMTKKGVKELSEDAKEKIYQDCLSKVNDDNFAYVAGDVYGVIAKDEFKRSGFSDTEKKAIARKHADKIIGMFGIDKEITKMQPASQPKGDGKAVKGQANVAIDSPFKLIKPNEIRGYTTGANDPTKMASVPVGSLSFPINASGMDKPEMMDSSTGGKTGAIITPNSFYVSPDGNLYLTASSKSSEQIKAEGGVYSGAENVEGNNYVFSYRTNGTEFANAAKGILNTQPTWTLDNGKEVKIRTTKDIVNYFDQLEKLRGGNGLSLRNIKVGTPSSSPAKGKVSNKATKNMG